MSTTFTTTIFEQPITVSPDDIDFFEHVNNVVYLRWVQEISTSHWCELASEEQREAIGWVVVRHEIDYLASAKLDDELIGRTWVGTARKNLFERHVEILRARDQKVLARARSLWCPIDLRTHRPTRVGPDVYALFSAADQPA
ncbi:acyl-CoA thioesterase [Geomonas sp. Red32]|uniref:acyl-CoA thioesterase n=1 Tax=Geomonas sp. Red32 TaxID=2912856 RepID=UPI00202CE2FB|nr:acyl-CoA thioesterase [Geomonas sp. Red32]MCM0082852.1 acyl-CoA thioesterase [Geomonas sp. Red32]